MVYDEASLENWSASPDNPYVGLRPFREQDADVFFGRSEHILELVSRLKRTRFVAVVGTSGSGKSSLVRAGLIPQLRGGRMLGHGAGWRIAIFQPGNQPINRLAQAVAEALRAPQDDVGNDAIGIEFERKIRSTSMGLVDAIKDCQLPKNENLLIVVDQFEELFRYGDRSDDSESAILEYAAQSLDETKPALNLRDAVPPLEKTRAQHLREDEAEAFVKRLLSVSSSRDVSVFILITMRSEFLGDCNRASGLPEAVNEGLYLTPRLSRGELSEAITHPLAMREGSIVPGLVEQLLNDVSQDTDQLPILQHALMRSWRGPATISEDDYNRVGGTANALSMHATSIWADLDKRSRWTVEKLFRALTKPGPDSKGLRRPLSLSELCEVTKITRRELIDVIEVFRSPGNAFLQPPSEVDLSQVGSDDPVIDISHESLIRKWDKLQRWIALETQSGEAYCRLLQLVDLSNKSSDGFLLREGELRDFLRQKRSGEWNASWSKRYGGRYKDVEYFLLRSRLAIRAARLDEARQREIEQQAELIRQRAEFDAERDASALIEKQREIDQQIELEKQRLKFEEERRVLALEEERKRHLDRQKYRETLKRYAYLGLGVYLLVATLTALLLGHILRGVKRERTADYLQSQSVQRSNEFGASTQEVAALLGKASIDAAPRPSNADVIFWEAFGRLRRGEPVRVETLLPQSQSTIERISVFGSSKASHLALLYRPVNLRPITPMIFNSSTLQQDTSYSSMIPGGLSSISVDGRLGSSHCRDEHTTVWNFETETGIEIPCSVDFTSISQSADGALIAWMVLDTDLGQGEPLLGTVYVYEKATKRTVLKIGQVIGYDFSPNGRLFGFTKMLNVPQAISVLDALPNHSIFPTQQKLTPVLEFELKDLQNPGAPKDLLLLKYIASSDPVSFSPDGEFLAVGKLQGEIDLYDIRRKVMLRKGTIPAHRASVTALAFSHDSTLLATAGDDRVVRMVSVLANSNGTSKAFDSGRRSRMDNISGILWSDDFGRAASQLVFSHDDRTLGLALGEKTARFKDVRSGFERVRVTHADRVTSVAFSVAGDTAFSVAAAPSSELLRVNLIKGDLPQDSAVVDCAQPQQARVSRDGMVVAVSCTKDYEGELSGKSVSPDDRSIRPEVDVYMLSELQASPPISKESEKIAVGLPFPIKETGRTCETAVSYDGSFVLAKCRGKLDHEELSGYDTRTKRRFSISIPGDFSHSDTDGCVTRSLVSMALNVSGTRLALGDDCGRYAVYLLDRSTEKPVLRLEGKMLRFQAHTASQRFAPITSLAFSATRGTLAAGDAAGFVGFYQLGNTDAVRTIDQYDSAITSIQFADATETNAVNPERVIVVAGPTASIVDTVSLAVIFHITLPSPITAAALAASQEYAALGSQDGRVNILDLKAASGSWNWLESHLLKSIGYDTTLDPWFGPHLMATWSVPVGIKPNLSHASPEVFSLRFLGEDKLEVIQNQGLLLEDADATKRDYALPTSRLSLTAHNYLHILSRDAAQSICSNVRADVQVPNGLRLDYVCPNLTPSGRPGFITRTLGRVR